MSKKGSDATQYDPQIGAAAQATAQSSAAAQQFSQDFYREHISPMLDEMVSSSHKTQDREDTLFGLNMKQTQEAQDRYDRYGKPAEQRYYDMVSRYSEPAEAERQASAALGDMRTAEEGQQGAMFRSLAARGINPSSPGVTSTLGSMAVGNAAAEAGAMNRARNVARTMGMTLTGDAANFGRGGQSSVLAFSQAASGNAQGSFGVANGALGGANGSAGVPLAGYNTAISGYGSNMSNYTKLGTTDMQLQAQSDAAFGQAVGQIAGLAGTAMMMSDVRLKRNIKKIGQHSNGLGLYEFDYKWGGPRQVGVMADEVEQLFPDAVAVSPGGYKMVNYRMVGERCASV